MSLVGVVTNVTSAITGAVVSVVVVVVVVVVVEDVLSVDADEPPSSLPHEIMVRLKRKTNKMCKILFIFSPISNERRRFEELLFQHFTNRLSNQFDIIAHSRPNFIYFKTIWFRRGIILKRAKLQGRKRKEVTKLPCKYYINIFYLLRITQYPTPE